MSGVAAADPLLLDPAAKKLPPLPPHVASSVSLDTLTDLDSDESRLRSESSAADSMLQEPPCVATLQDIGECVPVLVQDYIDLELRKPHQAVGIKDKVPLCASAVLKKESSAGEKWRRISWTLVLFLVVGSLLIMLGRVHLTQLLKCLEDLPFLQSLFIFILLFTLVSFPFGFGYIILNLMAGYLYGFVQGQIVVMVSVAVGFSVSFLLCRSWMRDYARGIITSAALQAIMRVVEGPNANKVMLLMRLTPIPFGLQNVLFAMTSVGYWPCLVGTMLGLFPTQVLNIYLASTVRNMQEVLADRADGYIILLLQVLISIVLMLYVLQKARVELAKLTRLDTAAQIQRI